MSLPEDVWNKEFPISSVTRSDLVSAGFPRAVVEQISDEEMQEIASAMEDVYCDHGYWEDLELCTDRLLRAHEEEDDQTTEQEQSSGLT